MFILGKILNDTPEKVSNLILTLIKLILTIWFVSKLFDSPLKILDFKVEEFFKSFDAMTTLYYLVVAVAIWYLLWGLLKIILNVFILALSSLVKGEQALHWYLTFIGAAKFEDKRLIETNPNIRWFTDSLEEQNESPFIINIKFDRVFGISFLAYIALLYSQHLILFSFQFWVASVFLLNSLILAVLQYKWSNYYSSNAPKLKAQFYQIGKKQTLVDALNLVDRIKDNYNIEIKRKRLFLQLKESVQSDWMPQCLVINVVFIPDDLIGKQMFENFENRLNSKENHLTIFATNINKFEKPLHFVDDSNVVIRAINIDQMYIRFTDLFNTLSRKHYSQMKVE